MKPANVNDPLGNMIFGGLLGVCSGGAFIAQLPNLWNDKPVGILPDAVVPSILTAAALALIGFGMASARWRVVVDAGVVRWTHSVFGLVWHRRELPRDDVRALKARSTV